MGEGALCRPCGQSDSANKVPKSPSHPHDPGGYILGPTSNTRRPPAPCKSMAGAETGATMTHPGRSAARRIPMLALTVFGMVALSGCNGCGGSSTTGGGDGNDAGLGSSSGGSSGGITSGRSGSTTASSGRGSSSTGVVGSSSSDAASGGVSASDGASSSNGSGSSSEGTESGTTSSSAGAQSGTLNSSGDAASGTLSSSGGAGSGSPSSAGGASSSGSSSSGGLAHNGACVSRSGGRFLLCGRVNGSHQAQGAVFGVQGDMPGAQPVEQLGTGRLKVLSPRISTLRSEKVIP